MKLRTILVMQALHLSKTSSQYFPINVQNFFLARLRPEGMHLQSDGNRKNLGIRTEILLTEIVSFR